jgi:hypothetical protein
MFVFTLCDLTFAPCVVGAADWKRRDPDFGH